MNNKWKYVQIKVPTLYCYERCICKVSTWWTPFKFSNRKKEKKDDQKHSLASFSMNEWKLVDIAFVAKKVENKKEKICFSCVYLSPWKLVTKIPKRHYFRHFFLFLLEINSKSKFLFLTNIWIPKYQIRSHNTMSQTCVIISYLVEM